MSRNLLPSASVHGKEAIGLFRDLKEHCEDVNGRFAKWSLGAKHEQKDEENT